LEINFHYEENQKSVKIFSVYKNNSMQRCEKIFINSLILFFILFIIYYLFLFILLILEKIGYCF